MSLHVLLFDMDDVLLHPGGYQRALIETVAWTGRLLGFREAPLTTADIAQFEAAGSTSEWDTAAMCAALLLLEVWKLDPGLRLPASIQAPPAAAHDLPAPDFRLFAQVLAETPLPHASPWVKAELLLVPRAERLSSGHQESLKSLLRGARQHESSLTFRIFQELVLGSAAYAEAYQAQPAQDVEGTLTTHDRQTLEPHSTQALLSWLSEPDHSAAIFTNRPSLSPDGAHGTPEAEMGRRMAGLEGVPIVGMGALSWLSAAAGAAPEAFLKPSPVHVLAALQAALGAPLESALRRALDLVNGKPDPSWKALRGARLAAFEDAAKGLLSAAQAQRILAGQGVSIELRLCGITHSSPKRAALEKAGAELFPDLSRALMSELASAPV